MSTGLQWLDVGVLGLLGLLIGSFLNVVIHRLPKMMEQQWAAEYAEMAGKEPPAQAPFNLMVPRSRCPHCGHRIRWFENIPVLSFLALRGKCSQCGAGIGWRYPGVELLAGLLFAWSGWRWGLGASALMWCGFAAAVLALACIDWDTTLLPDDITLPLLWAGLVAAALGVTPTHLADAVWGAVGGYLSLWLVYWAFKLLTGKEGMGHGDFKLLAALGAWCGVAGILPIVLMSSFIGAIVGSLWIGLRGRDRATPIPFGPYLAAAGWVQLMWGPQLLQAYRDFSGLN